VSAQLSVQTRWREEDRKLVVPTLSERADGIRGVLPHASISSHISVGSNGCTASWKRCDTVFHQVWGAFLNNFPKRWTRRTSGYKGISIRDLKHEEDPFKFVCDCVSQVGSRDSEPVTLSRYDYVTIWSATPSFTRILYPITPSLTAFHA
jgi:hypothetical protein